MNVSHKPHLMFYSRLTGFKYWSKMSKIVFIHWRLEKCKWIILGIKHYRLHRNIVHKLRKNLKVTLSAEPRYSNPFLPNLLHIALNQSTIEGTKYSAFDRKSHQDWGSERFLSFKKKKKNQEAGRGYTLPASSTYYNLIWHNFPGLVLNTISNRTPQLSIQIQPPWVLRDDLSSSHRKQLPRQAERDTLLKLRADSI